MKKSLLTLVAVLILVVTACAVLTACSDDTDALTIKSYEITETKVNVGDAFSAPTITATLSDDSTKTVTNNLVYDEDDLALLELADGKYTKSGSYEIKVYILEQRDASPYYIGTWKLTVRVNK